MAWSKRRSTGYAKVQTDLTIMRRNGELAYDWLADNTRWQRKPRTFNGVEEALQHTAEFYRKSLWADADCYAEIWLEKDALAGVIYPVTATYDVPLNRLRRLVQQAIEQHLPKRQFKVLKAAEESERAIIGRLVRIATSSTTGIGGEDAP